MIGRQFRDSITRSLFASSMLLSCSKTVFEENESRVQGSVEPKSMQLADSMSSRRAASIAAGTALCEQVFYLPLKSDVSHELAALCDKDRKSTPAFLQIATRAASNASEREAIIIEDQTNTDTVDVIFGVAFETGIVSEKIPLEHFQKILAGSRDLASGTIRMAVVDQADQIDDKTQQLAKQKINQILTLNDAKLENFSTNYDMTYDAYRLVRGKRHNLFATKYLARFDSPIERLNISYAVLNRDATGSLIMIVGRLKTRHYGQPDSIKQIFGDLLVEEVNSLQKNL